MNKKILFGLLCGAASVCTSAYAQTASSQGAAGSSQAPAYIGLEEVIVTAQRQAESSQRAAIAIDVIKPEVLTQVTEPQNLTKLAPALQIGNGGGSSPVLYVRGVGTFSVNPYTDSAVAVNYDGIYLGRPTSAFGLFYDLERIEVLKGPQGTLYGRNATGGALNVLPAQPKIGVHETSGTVSVGNYSAVNAQAAVNLPLSDKAALRVAGVGYSHDGYNTDGTYSENGKGGRAQLLLKPTDGVSLRVGADYFKLGGTGPTGTLVSADNAAGVAVPFGLGGDVGLYDSRSQAALNSVFVGLSGATYGAILARPRLDNQYYGVNGELNANLGFGDLAVVAGWRRSDVGGVTAPTTFTIQSDETDEQYSLEARLSGKAGPLNWLVGAYGFTESVSSHYVVNSNLLAANQTLKQDSDSYAGFARLTYNVTDAFRLTGAARYTQDKKTFDGISDVVTAICTSPTHVCPGLRRLPADVSNLPAALASIGFIRPPGVPVYIDATGVSGAIYSPARVVVDNTTSPEKLTYRAAAEFEPRPGSLLYASVETGYRSGGFSFSSIKPVYAPESITAYTFGSKNRFLDDRLQVNAEVFYWNYRDQQVAHQATGATGGLEFVTENIGASTNKGVEVEITAKPLPDTLLFADVQYLSARNDGFVFADVDTSSLAGLPPGTIPPATVCPSTPVVGKGTYRIDCSGLRALRSPEWTLNLGIQQTVRLSNGLALAFEGNTHYQSSNIVMFERRAFSVQDAYWTSDASVSLAPESEAWKVAAYVNNIEDKIIFNATYFNTLNAITSANPSAPRTYGARLSFRF